jgi:hypothetical protein
MPVRTILANSLAVICVGQVQIATEQLRMDLAHEFPKAVHVNRSVVTYKS